MHWSFALNFFAKSSMQKFNALKFCNELLYQKFNAKFNALNFFTKSSMQKFNALNFRAEVLHWSFGSQVHCIAFFGVEIRDQNMFFVWNAGSGLIFVRFPWWNLETLKVCGELRIKLYRRKKPPTVQNDRRMCRWRNGNPSQENFLGTLSKGQTVPFSNWNYRTNWESFDIHVV